MKKIMAVLGTLSLTTTPTVLTISCHNSPKNQIDSEINENTFFKNKFGDFMNEHLDEINLIRFNPYIQSKTLLEILKNKYLPTALKNAHFSQEQINDSLDNVQIFFTFGDINSKMDNNLDQEFTLLKGQIVLDFSFCQLVSGKIFYSFDHRINFSIVSNMLTQDEINKIKNTDNLDSSNPYEATKLYLKQMVEVLNTKYDSDESFKKFIDVNVLENKQNGFNYFNQILNATEVITLSNDCIFSGYNEKDDLYETEVKISGIDVDANEFSSQFFSFDSKSDMNLKITKPKEITLNTANLKQFDCSAPNSASTIYDYDDKWLHIKGFNLENTLSEIDEKIKEGITNKFHSNDDFKGSGFNFDNVKMLYLKALSSNDDNFWNGGYKNDENIWNDNAKLSAITKGKDFDESTENHQTSSSVDYVRVFNIYFDSSTVKNISVVSDGPNRKLCSFHLYVILDDVKNAMVK